MTKEEAIKIIGQYDVNFYWTGGEHEGEKIPADELMDAFDMAIEALRQEPCEDAISREGVHDEVIKLWNSGGDLDYCMETLLDFIAESPAVTPIRPKGKWMWKEVRQNPSLVCSNCLSDLGSICPEKYCPTCGSYNGDIWRDTSWEDNNADSD